MLFSAWPLDWYKRSQRLLLSTYSTVEICYNTRRSTSKWNIGRKSRFFIRHLHSTPPLGGPCRNIAITFGIEKLEWWSLTTVRRGLRQTQVAWSPSQGYVALDGQLLGVQQWTELKSIHSKLYSRSKTCWLGFQDLLDGEVGNGG